MHNHDAELSQPQAETRRWAEIERNMECARDLRSRQGLALLLATFRRLRRPFGQFRALPGATLVRALVACCAIPLIVSAAMDRAAAQEAKIAGLESPGESGDRARLAALGIAEAMIEREENLEALWRAVRELVLPGRVSEATQRRLLRRVWRADPAIRDAVADDSTAY